MIFVTCLSVDCTLPSQLKDHFRNSHSPSRSGASCSENFHEKDEDEGLFRSSRLIDDSLSDGNCSIKRPSEPQDHITCCNIPFKRVC
jgi:hypothetical protein